MQSPTRTCSIRILTMCSLLVIVCSCAHRVHEHAGLPAALGLGKQYHVVHGWPVLPEGEMLGGVVGVAVDSHENVFVFHHAGREWPDDGELDVSPIENPTIVEFDGRTGAVRARWGDNQFAMPHGLTIDAHDQVWLTDVALHQVYKFTHDGKLLMTLGESAVAGNDSTHFNRPSGVAVLPDGSFYVSDGYLNTRVVKFSAEGKFLFQWGTKGSGPGEFDLVHGIALDAAGRVYVADRSNLRVQIFDPSGRYLTEWKSADIGRPYNLAFDRTGLAFIADGGDQPYDGPDRSGVAIIRPDGTLAGRFGRYGNYDGQFAVAHGIAVAKDGAVYVADTIGRRVQKFVAD